MSNFLIYSEEEYAYLLQPAGYAVLIALLVLILLAGHFFGRKKQVSLSAKQLAFSGIAIAIAMVTSQLKFVSLPFGGSITFFSMFFITLVGYLYGLRVGLITGLAYGLLQLITNPYIFAPIQVLLDYPLAFGALGLAGVFTKKKFGMVKGYTLGVFMRYAFHVISGQIFFLSYAPETMDPTLYNLSYNATYILPEFVLTLILLCLPPVQKAIAKIKEMTYHEGV